MYNELLLGILYGIIDVLQRIELGYTENLDYYIRDILRTYYKLVEKIEGDNNE
jgi:hypothetical protein